MSGSKVKGIENSASIWGKTLSATGGTLLFLISLLAWGGSGARTIQETEFALTLNLLTILPIAVTLVPKVRNRMRGVLIFAALAIDVIAGYQFPILVTFLLPLGSLILVGGVLVLSSDR